MARLRLYFGSSRSNTAPEILEGDSEEQHGDVVAALRTPPPPPAALRPTQEPGERHVPQSAPSLKRSSSMFIPQLAAYAEPRPTKSSSMHISLQRSDGSGSGDSFGQADDVPPPCYTPPGPAPAYTERLAEADTPRQPPPPYYPPESSQSFMTEPNNPKRRVFSIGSNGHTVYSRGQPGISVGGIRIRRNSTDASDTRHLRIRPYGGWTVQQETLDQPCGANGGTQRLVFQLQQNQNQHPSPRTAASQEDSTKVGYASGSRVVRYPRIRLERSSSHQMLLLENEHETSGADMEPTEQSQCDMRTQKIEGRNPADGCTFKISGETPKRQPHFKIYFNPGGGGNQDVNHSSDSKVR